MLSNCQWLITYVKMNEVILLKGGRVVSVGLRITQKRKELGLNQTELAQKAGLKPAAINQYESGERKPSFEALIKLSGALKVSTDYLIGSGGYNSDLLSDPVVKMILKTMESLTDSNRRSILQYSAYLLNQPLEPKYPIFSDVLEYAEYILNETGQNDLPVDLYAITGKLNINIIEASDLGYEGVLLKQGDVSIILMDKRIIDVNRRRFTIAHLIGHYAIPWHNKTSFYCRKFGTSTLKTNDIMEIEANNFAAALLMPKFHLEKDILNKRPTIDQLDSLAHDKYCVSLFALANRLIEFTTNKHALINSKNDAIEKVFQGSRPIVEELHPGTIASQFFTLPPSEKCTRSEVVPASYWFADAAPGEEIYEESMYNPEYEAVLSLITTISE